MRQRATIVAVMGLGIVSILAGCARQGQYVYTVQEGDKDLSAVAQKVYGDAKLADALAEANPEVDPQALKPGQKLVVPELTDAEGQKTAPKFCDRTKVY